MWSAEVHVRRTTSLATQRVRSPAGSISRAVSQPTRRVLTIRRSFAAIAAPVAWIERPPARPCRRLDAAIRSDGAAFAVAASPAGDESALWARGFSPRSRRCSRRRSCADQAASPASRRWHEACTAAPATGTRYAAVASTILKAGSFANRFFDMRSHDGAGFLRQHHVSPVVGGSASCQSNIHKSKKVCRGQRGLIACARSSRARPTGKRP